jgi:tetratricopeptide (TPR) repeat protein
MNRKPPRVRTWVSVILLAGLALPALAQKSRPAPASVDQIEAAIKRDPANSKLYVELGLAYWDKNDSQHALDAFQQAVRIGPSSAEAHNWLGVALMEKSDLPGAIAELRKAVSLNPTYARAYANLGSSLSTSGDLTEAIEVFKKALALEPNSVTAHLNLGIALRQHGDAEGALAHLRRVAEAEPNDFHVQYELAQTLRQSGDLAGAVAAFENALQIQPELREGYYGLGLALKQQSAAVHKPVARAPSPADEPYKHAQEAAARGDLDTAKEQLSEALRLDESHAESHNLLGFIFGQQGDLDSSLVHLRRSVALQPDSADAHYHLGVALWYSGSRKDALTELRQSVRLDPAAGASHAFLGTALRESGDLAAARQSLQRAIALLPPLPATYIDLGIVYLRLSDLDKALGQFEAGLNLPWPSPPPAPDWDAAIDGLRGALAKDPNRPEAHDVLGLLLGRKGASTSEVVAEFREAVRLRPNFAEAYNSLGLVLTQADDDRAAIKAYREALRISPDYADAHANLGAALIPTDAEQAIVELEKAVALAPASVKAQFNLATAYAASPSHGAAKEVEQLRKVIALAPTFPRAHLLLGEAVLRDGKIAEAIEQLQEATKLDPQSGEAHYQLGLALARAGRKDEAAVEVQKGRDLSSADDRNQNANLDMAEGQDAFNKGDLDLAAAKFRHAIRLQPEASDAQRYLGMVLEKQGDIDGASAAYHKALELNLGDVSAKQGLDRLQNTKLADAGVPAPKPVNDAPGPDDPAKVAEFEGYIRQNRFKDLEPLLSDYVLQRPKSSWGWYALGYTQFAQQKIADSIRSLAKSLQLDIGNAEAHKILGRDLMIIGRFDAAQIEFEQGIRYSPQSAEIHYNLGKLFSIQDNWESARKEFEAALQLDPSYVEALDAKGLTLEALGDDAGAVAEYRKAIALNEARNGTFASPQVNLSAFYNRTSDPGKALEYANQALELDPKSDRAWFQKAKADEGQGRLNDAVDAVNRAISINPRASSYYYVLAGFYRRLGKMEDSRKALDSFSRLDKETNELEKLRRSGNRPGGSPPRPGGEHE